MIVTKMQGAGNDFLIINNMDGRLPESVLSGMARHLCRRRVSIGADGMMIVQRSSDPDADFSMLFFNADGSLGEMCGNGARCICRYGYEKHLAGTTQRIQTTAGIVIGERISNRLYRIRLNDISCMKLSLQLQACGQDFTVHYVEMGNPGLPHAIVHIPGLQHKDPEQLRSLGKALRYHTAFPKGANVNFYDVIGTNVLQELTYERGVEDFTFACGTGTGTVVSVLACLHEVSGRDTEVHMPGGILRVTTNVADSLPHDIYLTGPTTFVTEGELLDENLRESDDLAPLLDN